MFSADVIVNEVPSDKPRTEIDVIAIRRFASNEKKAIYINQQTTRKWRKDNHK